MRFQRHLRGVLDLGHGCGFGCNTKGLSLDRDDVEGQEQQYLHSRRPSRGGTFRRGSVLILRQTRAGSRFQPLPYEQTSDVVAPWPPQSAKSTPGIPGRQPASFSIDQAGLLRAERARWGCFASQEVARDQCIRLNRTSNGLFDPMDRRYGLILGRGMMGPSFATRTSRDEDIPLISLEGRG